MPTWNFPLRTVACSSTGCQCGGTFTPSGCLMRMTNGEPFFIGSPERMAQLKGPTNGFHSILSGDVIAWGMASGEGPAKTGGASTTMNNESNGIFLIVPSLLDPIRELRTARKGPG